MLAEATAADGTLEGYTLMGQAMAIWGRRRLCQYTPGASRGRLLYLADARLKMQAQAFVNGVIPYIPAPGREGTNRRLEAR